MAIKDLWNLTTEPNMQDFKYLHIFNVSFDRPINFVSKMLNWRKRIYDFHGLNIVVGIKILPFRVREGMIDNKECIVLDYGYMQDYIRPYKDIFIGVCVIRDKKALWFMLSQSKDGLPSLASCPVLSQNVSPSLGVF
jgi:hypothetical protein